MNHRIYLSETSPIVVLRNSWRIARDVSVCKFLLASLLALQVSAAYSAEIRSAPREVRESAVQQARSGDAKGALLILQGLVRNYPDDPALMADTTIVANWAGDDRYALDIYARAQTPKDNSGTVEAAARSARNLHQYDLALNLYRRAEALAPDRWQAQLGSVMVLTDQGELSAAAELMKSLLRRNGKEPDVERGQAYLCLRQQDFSCAINMYQQLLEQGPKEREVLQCQLANAISQLGGNTLAATMCDAADASERLRLNAATGAERVRWTESVDHSWPQRKVEGEHALAQLNDVIAASHPEDAVWRGAQFDRLLAFHNLYRMRDVVRAWENLQQLKIDVPDYALARVAAAYLALRQPRQAESLYRDLIRRSPDNGDLWAGLAYAELEREHIREAFHTIDQAYLNSPAWLQSPGLKDPQPNLFHASLATQAAEMRGYADMPAEEQARLTDLLGQAPASATLHHALAMTYLARGWPLLAMREERIANSFEQKGDLPVLEDAQILEAAGRRKDVDALLPALLEREGISASAERFLKERAIERGWQSTVVSGHEWSSGQFLGNSQRSEAYLYSPFMNARWRIYAHAVGDTGDFAAGSAYRTRTALGFSYSYNRQLVWGEAAGDIGNAGSIAAGAIGAQFALGNYWIFGVEGDTDDVADVQLITQLAGVRARSAAVNIEWRQSELRSIRTGLQRMLFSDGNQRSAVTGSWSQRVWTRPRLQIDISPQVWASTNSKDQSRVYFNPKHDLSLGSSASVNWITWRSYDRSLRQQLTIYSGPYWEENYGFKAAVSTGYTQNWKIGKRLGFVGHVAWNGQPYDGSRQPFTDLSFGVTWGNQ
jgi:biofilm PGA synthesis protein PgaA